VQAKEGSLHNVIEDAGLVARSQIEISRDRAAQAHMDWLDLSTRVIPPDVIDQIRADDARRFKVIPVGWNDTGLIVAGPQ
jgi:hypothetical protein